jgi:hypothetical protein
LNSLNVSVLGHKTGIIDDLQITCGDIHTAKSCFRRE